VKPLAQNHEHLYISLLSRAHLSLEIFWCLMIWLQDMGSIFEHLPVHQPRSLVNIMTNQPAFEAFADRKPRGQILDGRW
jgi:hypothetical protein